MREPEKYEPWDIYNRLGALHARAMEAKATNDVEEIASILLDLISVLQTEVDPL